MPRRRRQQHLAQVDAGLAVGREPARVEHLAFDHVRGRNRARGGIPEPYASAGNEVPGTRETQMPGNELRMWNAIAVGEDEVFRRRLDDGTIEDAAFAKADVFLPHVTDVEAPGLPSPLDAGAGFFARSVVGDDDLETS